MRALASYRLINHYRKFGHLHANVNPLQAPPQPIQLADQFSPLSETSRAKLDVSEWMPGWSSAKDTTTAKLKEYLDHAYCGSLAVELDHIADEDKRRWLAERVENRDTLFPVSDEERIRALQLLIHSDVFDGFLQVKFRNLKRYALEGLETMLPAMDELFRTAGVPEIVIGMPHRGRLNLLCSLLKFPPSTLFRKIKGESDVPESVNANTGDVISHLAINSKLKYGSDRVNVSLLHNPSHLEGVNPVAQGRTHARQTLAGGGTDSALCLQVHGDAAFALQGVNYETVQLARLPAFSVGGSVHLIVNNQIGFTAEARTGRSSRYSSDLGKMMEFPVLRVNGNDPEAVLQAVRIANAYRREFRDDVFVDLIGFRRHGHNELDEPRFTNPHMYRTVSESEPISKIYARQGAAAGWLPDEYVEQETARARGFLDAEWTRSLNEKGTPVRTIPHLEKEWKPYVISHDRKQPKVQATGLSSDELSRVGMTSVQVPEDFKVHSRLKKVFLDQRTKRLQSGSLDWALAETLAIGSLLSEDYGVRLCGQDSGRGTFSHRHLALTCQETQQVIHPLQNAGSGRLQVINSPLAELAVLAFEYGWSVEHPNNLVMWEAQFGDFFNSAQVTIDTFVSSGEHKWQRPSAITILLPHGYDGAGPEHSSCRMERFLQQVGTPSGDVTMAADDLLDLNWRVINPTTPANYFHALRRQMHSSVRKPLVVVAPKTLLRHPSAVSSYKDVAVGTSYVPVIDDPSADGSETEVIFCSGKVYYELVDERKAKNIQGKAIVRLEELAPFPYQEIEETLKRYPNIKKMTWFQEECENMGAYSYVAPRFSRFERQTQLWLNYVGRPAQAAPAVGIAALHKKQVEDLFTRVFQ